MPEGDTILRAARSLGRWLEGRTITAARTNAAAVPAHKLVGQQVVGVEARAKHLLIRFDSGMVLHTHMRMTGAWHVYPTGEKWRKPAHQARIVLEAGDRTAVCFNAPVVELLAKGGEAAHPSLARLGPDVLGSLDLAEVRRRAAGDTRAIGEVLLDQQVVSGIGNIWRCETLFANRVDPWTPAADVPLDALVETAARLMQASVDPDQRRPRPNVYGRTGRPCYRCRTPIATAKLGEQARDVYWCPNCQRGEIHTLK
jgi:endonuclease VIII